MIRRPWTPQEPIQEPEPFNLDISINEARSTGTLKQEKTPEEWASYAQELATDRNLPIVYGGQTYAPQEPEPASPAAEAGAENILAGGNQELRAQITEIQKKSMHHKHLDKWILIVHL